MPFYGGIKIIVSGGGSGIVDVDPVDGIQDTANRITDGTTIVTPTDFTNLSDEVDDKADITYVDNRLANLNVDGGTFV